MKSIKITSKENAYFFHSNEVAEHLKLVNYALRNLVEVLESKGKNKIAKKNIINLAFERGDLSRLLTGSLKEEMHNSLYERYVKPIESILM